MALPKRRHSRTRGRKRRTNWKVALPNVSECPQCHNPKLPHHICPSCGYYKGRQVITPREV
jgi:large subunit ribosomal protein L32